MKFYRYRIAYKDIPTVELSEFVLDKETPKGYWIRPLYGGYLGLWKKWIPKKSRKRYAYPTKKEALDSFIARKKKQVQYSKTTLWYAEETLRIAQKMKDDG